jgi:Leucine-rich repeat (LRR) protein
LIGKLETNYISFSPDDILSLVKDTEGDIANYKIYLQAERTFHNGNKNKTYSSEVLVFDGADYLDNPTLTNSDKEVFTELESKFGVNNQNIRVRLIDGEYRIVELDLSDLDLEERGKDLFEKIVELEKLESLKLGGNKFTDFEIPEALFDLNELRTLEIENTNLHQNYALRVPAKSDGVPYYKNCEESADYGTCLLKKLSTLQNLRTLKIAGHRNLTGEIPTEISNLQKLRYLDLSGNAFDGNIPSAVGKLTKLQELLLPENNFDGILTCEDSNGLNDCGFQYIGKISIGGNHGLKTWKDESEVGDFARLAQLIENDTKYSVQIDIINSPLTSRKDLNFFAEKLGDNGKINVEYNQIVDSGNVSLDSDLNGKVFGLDKKAVLLEAVNFTNFSNNKNPVLEITDNKNINKYEVSCAENTEGNFSVIAANQNTQNPKVLEIFPTETCGNGSSFFVKVRPVYNGIYRGENTNPIKVARQENIVTVNLFYDSGKQNQIEIKNNEFRGATANIYANTAESGVVLEYQIGDEGLQVYDDANGIQIYKTLEVTKVVVKAFFENSDVVIGEIEITPNFVENISGTEESILNSISDELVSGNSNWKCDGTSTNLQTCNLVTIENGYVTGLDLSGQQLSGAIPYSITNLTNLTNLNLSNNSFDSIPSNFDNLEKLSVLNENTGTGLNLRNNRLVTPDDLTLKIFLTGKDAQWESFQLAPPSGLEIIYKSKDVPNTLSWDKQTNRDYKVYLCIPDTEKICTVGGAFTENDKIENLTETNACSGEKCKYEIPD